MTEPLSVHVDFMGRAAFLSDEICINRAKALFPKMTVFSLNGRQVFECRQSSGSIKCGKSVCMYMDIPDNQIWEGGVFEDEVVVKE